MAANCLYLIHKNKCTITSTVQNLCNTRPSPIVILITTILSQSQNSPSLYTYICKKEGKKKS